MAGGGACDAPAESLADPDIDYAYDDAGQLLTETDLLGNVTTYAYDFLGGVTSVTRSRKGSGNR